MYWCFFEDSKWVPKGKNQDKYASCYNNFKHASESCTTVPKWHCKNKQRNVDARIRVVVW